MVYDVLDGPSEISLQDRKRKITVGAVDLWEKATQLSKPGLMNRLVHDYFFFKYEL